MVSQSTEFKSVSHLYEGILVLDVRQVVPDGLRGLGHDARVLLLRDADGYLAAVRRLQVYGQGR